MDIKGLAEKCTKQTPEAALPRPPVSENWSEIFSVRWHGARFPAMSVRNARDIRGICREKRARRS